MATFKDRTGHEWTVEILLDQIPALRECGLDLSKLAVDKDPAQLEGVLLDPERLGQILWTLCEEEAEKLGLDPRGFARRFNADALAEATDAVLLAITDVVYKRPELRRMFREKLPEVWAKAERTAQAEASKATGNDGSGYSG